jgi:AcrR family transcriptional regulator
MPVHKKNSAMRKPRNRETSKAAILDAAIDEFAQRGYEGARIDAIAKNTNTTRAMVYYYFSSKEQLYAAVLETVYQGIRESEKTLDLEHIEAEEAIRRLVAFTFDYYQDNPNFVKIVVAENQAGGRAIRKMARMQRINRSIIQVLGDVLQRGARRGTLRRGLDAVDVHMLIASLGWFQIANRYSFGVLFNRDFAAPAIKARHKALIVDAIMRFVTIDHQLQTAVPRANSDGKTRADLARVQRDSTNRLSRSS